MGHLQFHEKKPLFKNKLFYLSLIACMVAFGISSYTAVNRLKQSDIPNADNSSTESTASFSEVDKTVSDAPYPSEPQTTSPTDTANQDEQVLPKAPYFLLPISGEVMKDFDSETLQYSETYKDWRLHLGVDFTAEKGAEVTSAAQGVVDDIYKDSQWGTVVAIDHGNSLILFYCGLNQTPTVNIGDTVKAGDILGTIDTIPCESVEQPHLHLSAEQDGTPVAPLVVMGLMG